ncbi:hypothetical protein Msi02_82230 [Microbispora siamensis]|uniref:Uncharacterized protein n=2 Tax=Streptosporangiaceae TaxID=2004 RepID=A0ABQ4H141_9ACTN|nr:hypothetical protein Msi02_82230 [Microbispora siamensis]
MRAAALRPGIAGAELSVGCGRIAVIMTTTTAPTITAPADVPTRPLPVELVDGPGGRLYLLPFAPLTPDDCEALSVLLAARAAAVRRNESA